MAWLTEFLNRLNVSMIISGKNNHAYVEKVDGKKIFLQKRLTLLELLNITNSCLTVN